MQSKPEATRYLDGVQTHKYVRLENHRQIIYVVTKRSRNNSLQISCNFNYISKTTGQQVSRWLWVELYTKQWPPTTRYIFQTQDRTKMNG